MKILLFGPLEIVNGRRVVPRFPTRKSRDLFAYLAIHGHRMHSRDALAGLLWPESPERGARKCLRTEIWRLRRLLAKQELDDSLLRVDKERVGLVPHGDVWIDVSAFEACLQPVGGLEGNVTGDGARRLREAVEIYRGELLEGHYEDLFLDLRERFHLRFLSALEQLVAFHRARREWRPAIYYGTEIVHHDPLAEHIHRELMVCHWKMGNRTAALRQYQRCVEVLRSDLDVEPMGETAALYQQIKEC